MAAKKPAKKTTRKKPAAPKPEPVFIERTDRKIKPVPSGKNSACPECGAFPTITKIRRPGYELRRCRVCDHIFEIKKGGE